MITKHPELQIEYRTPGDGQSSAITLLRQSNKIETKVYDFGSLLLSIDGRICDQNKQECWGLFLQDINGIETLSQKGGDSLIAAEGEIAIWRLCVYTID